MPSQTELMYVPASKAIIIENVPVSTPSIAHRGWNQVQHSTSIAMNRQLSPLEEMLKAIQSITQRPHEILNSIKTEHWSPTKKNVPVRTPPTVTSMSTSRKTNRLWRDDFLQKSPSFTKALRRSGRNGKVIIQGWVAFRGDIPWKEIIRNPKRCDFRYVVLLDDKPLLHLFRSRGTKSNAKRYLLHDCKSLDLMGDIGVRVNLVSKEMGNEVCIFDYETGIEHCSLLAIPMPQCFFLDGNRSRLANDEALRGVFEPYRKVVKFAPSLHYNDGHVIADATAASLPSPVEQNDVSRHLLFTIDVVIKFPPPRATKVSIPPANVDVVVNTSPVRAD